LLASTIWLVVERNVTPMTKEDYQERIPHACRFQTADEHMDYMCLCWSITKPNGIKKRGVEGPQYCHDCPESVRAERWDKVWYRKTFKK